MPYYYTENGVTIQGGISVIPEKYRNEARIHMEKVMMGRVMNRNVPAVVIDINKSYYYKLDEQLVPIFDHITNNFPIR